MKLLYLDIDGVLNTWPGRNSFGIDHICHERCQILRHIIQATGATIVLSSTWRLTDRNERRVRDALGAVGLDYQHKTADLFPRPRSREIAQHLHFHDMPVESYAILDDISEAGTGHEPNFFQTDDRDGLTIEIAGRIVTHLGRVLTD